MGLSGMNIRQIFLAVAVAGLNASAAWSDITSPEDVATLQAIRKLKDAGHYPEAQQQLKQLVSRVHGNPKAEETYLAALHEQAGCYLKMERYSEALKSYEQEEPIMAKLVGKDSRGYATMLDNWAQACLGANEIAKAEELQRRSIEIYKNCKPVPEADLGQDYGNLAQTYLKEKKLDKALETDQNAYNMLTKVLPANSPQLGIVLDNMGFILRSQGRLSEAETYHRQAFSMLQPLGVHPDVASAMDNIACCLGQEHKYKESLALFDREFAMWKQLYGTGSQQAKECLSRRATVVSQSQAWAAAGNK
jgi:tetratricopeptide (TPR) repeat protein